MSNKYAVFSNFDMLEPKFCDIAANYVKSRDYDGIILNGNFSGDKYVTNSHKSIKKRLKQAKKFKGIRKKFEPVEPSIEDLELALLKQERQSMSSKELIGYSYEDYLDDLLTSFANTNKEVFVNPGVIERCNEYSLLLDDMTSRYSNIIDTTKHTAISKKDHELVFVPGIIYQDFLENEHGFLIEKSYDSRIIPSTTEDELEITSIFGLQSLTDKIKDPQNALLFTSHPPKFKTDTAVDVYKQWELQNKVYKYFTKGNESLCEIYNPGDLLDDEFEVMDLAYDGALFKPAFQNTGDDFLTMFYRSIGVDKILVNNTDITPAAHTWQEKTLNVGEYSNELICTPSNMDKLLFGEVEIKDNKARLIPLSLNDIMIWG